MNILPIQSAKRILVVDDNPAIHEDMRKILAPAADNPEMERLKADLFGGSPMSPSSASFEIASAFQGEEGLRLVDEAKRAGRPFALAFIDVRMPPGWDGIETISRIWKVHPDLQVVLCTAYADYSWEEMVRQIGPSDSLLILKKPFDKIEVLQMAHALTEKWALNHQLKNRLNYLDELVAQRTSELEATNHKLKKEVADRVQAEQALRMSEERFSKAFKASPIPLAIQSLLDERFVDANAGFEKLLGYTADELSHHTAGDLRLWAEPEVERFLLDKLRKELSLHNAACQFRHKSGRLLDILLSAELFELDGAAFLLIIAQDITDQLRLEGQLRQAQKMEAVGQLAAGIAHDFNNILTVVSGNASLLLGDKDPATFEARALHNICSSADRAARLVRQLLTFSRKQVTDIRPCQVREAFDTIAELLPRLIPPQIQLQFHAAPSLPLVNADTSMLETMLLNLAVNSRDAMPQGGQLALSVEAVEVDAAHASRNSEARCGRFIRLSVADTGCGISPEVMVHIFEPFFTTKPVGQGSGLGLATVYGIVKQHRGWIETQSAPGKGTTFEIYIPVLETKKANIQSPASPTPPAFPPPPAAAVSKPPKLDETILVVEDEPDLRDLVVQLLQSRGYNILAANNGAEAIAKWNERKRAVDLVLTDMVMPDGMTGQDLARHLLAERPDLPIIFTSGYSPGCHRNAIDKVDPERFLGKPYRPGDLFEIVQRCLRGENGAVQKAA